MAHVEKRLRNGRVTWRARYRTPDGREMSRTFPRRVDAERYLAAQDSAITRGDWVDPNLGRITIDKWVQRWLDSVRPTLKPSTVASYESLHRSRIAPGLGTRPIAAVRPSDVQTFVSDLTAAGLSASRVRQAHVVLRQALDAAVRDGRVARNAALGVKLPRQQRTEAAYLEPNVVEAIAQAVPEPYGLLVRLLGTLGPRWGEAAALERRDVDLLRRRLSIARSMSEVSGKLVTGPTKTHAVRSVPLTPTLAEALEEHLAANVATAPDASLFTGPKGGRLRHSYFYGKVWGPTLKRLKLPAVGVHVLRHSAAAALIAAGASPKAVQTVLGHRSAAFSLTVYGHLFDADLDDLAARLDEVTAKFSRPHRGPNGESPDDRHGIRGV